MKDETHPWLKWPGCDRDQKTAFNNRLAELQFRVICPPRFLDPSVMAQLNIKAQLDELMRTRYEGTCENFEVKMWDRALHVTEQVYREWSLEFYSTFTVQKTKFKEHEFATKKLIYFRLGGKDHHISVPDFGVYTGIFKAEEVRASGFTRFFNCGIMDSKNFDVHAAWNELTGIQKHTGTSKTSSIRSPLLRLVHKLLTRSFCQRSTQTDKVYHDDLWLLHTFYNGGLTHYVNVPWYLACFMESRGAGRQHDSQICCGHFITRIAKHLKLANSSNLRLCAVPMEFRYITMQELDASKLLNKKRTGLVDEVAPTDGGGGTEEAVESEEGPGVSSGRDRVTTRVLMGQMKRLTGMMKKMGRDTGHRLNRIEAKVDSTVASYAYQNYHIARYQPYWENVAAAQASTSGAEWPQYAPPQLINPEAEESEESEDEEGEEEEE